MFNIRSKIMCSFKFKAKSKLCLTKCEICKVYCFNCVLSSQIVQAAFIKKKININFVPFISSLKFKGYSSELSYRQVFCKELKMTGLTALFQTALALDLISSPFSMKAVIPLLKMQCKSRTQLSIEKGF